MVFKVQNIFCVFKTMKLLRNTILKPKRLKSVSKFIIRECYNSQIINIAHPYKNLMGFDI